MHRIFAAWLIAIFSLTNLAAVDSYHSPEESLATKVEILRRSTAQNDNDGTPITFEEYWELVRNTRQAIVRLEAEPEAAIQQQLSALASQWETVTAVEFPDQSVMTVDPSYLVAVLQQDSPDLERLAALMDTLLKAHDEFPQKVFTIQDVEPLKEILTRPEFQWGEAPAARNPEWLQRILDAIAEFMNRIAYGIQNGIYYGRVPLVIAAVLIFILSLYFIIRNLSRNLVREAELAAENDDNDALLTSKGAMQRAQSLSGQGDYRNAVRYLYLSSLLILDEHGVLRYDRSRTNREYLRSVSSKPQLAKPLSDVIDVFDRVWYGFDSVDEETYQSYVKHVDELREKKE